VRLDQNCENSVEFASPCHPSRIRRRKAPKNRTILRAREVDAHPRPHQDPPRNLTLAQFQPARLEEKMMVKGAIQGEGLSDPARPREQFRPFQSTAARLDLPEPHHRFAGADKHGGGFASGARHEVEHVVHAVAKVDVGSTALLPHGRVARGLPVPGVAGAVLRTSVGLHFRDAQDDAIPTEELAYQLSGYGFNGSQIERSGDQTSAAKHSRPRM